MLFLLGRKPCLWVSGSLGSFGKSGGEARTLWSNLVGLRGLSLWLYMWPTSFTLFPLLHSFVWMLILCLFVGCFNSVLLGPVFSRQNALVLPITVLVVLNLLLTTDSTPKKKRNSPIKEILIYFSFFNVITERIYNSLFTKPCEVFVFTQPSDILHF